jgi:hypothetical protein
MPKRKSDLLVSASKIGPVQLVAMKDEYLTRCTFDLKRPFVCFFIPAAGAVKRLAVDPELPSGRGFRKPY